MTDFAKLSAPFPPDKVSWRVGPTTQDKKKGMALAYIDARDVMERLDEVCGPSGWQRRYPHVGTKTVCGIGIKVGDEWIWKEDGAGDTDNEAEKGALSDAFKRAAVSWGIGRYLYDTDTPWVEIEQHGKSYSIVKSEFAKLRRVLGGEPEKPIRVVSSAQPVELTESEKRSVAQLKRSIDATATGKDLEAWKTNAANVKLFQMLPPTLRAEVQAHATAHLKKIDQHATTAG